MVKGGPGGGGGGGWRGGGGRLRIGDAGKSVYNWVQTMYYLCIITVSQTFVVVF